MLTLPDSVRPFTVYAGSLVHVRTVLVPASTYTSMLTSNSTRAHTLPVVPAGSAVHTVPTRDCFGAALSNCISITAGSKTARNGAHIAVFMNTFTQIKRYDALIYSLPLNKCWLFSTMVEAKFDTTFAGADSIVS